MAKAQLVFVPSPLAGHLTSIMEFTKALIQHDPQLFITVLVIKLPFTRYTDLYLEFLTDSHPNIRLIHVPQPENTPSLDLLSKSSEKYLSSFYDAHKPLVRNIIQDIILSPLPSSDSFPVVGLVLDLICPSLLEVGDEFGIPSFIFLTSGAVLLNLMFYLPSRHEQVGCEFSFSDSEVSIPGFLNPVPTTVLPEVVFNKDGGYDAFMKIANGFKNCKGVVYNSFYELESYGIESSKNGNNPKGYPVGPLLNLKAHPNPETDRAEWEKIMKWLDNQPESSVVYLCFGSASSFGESQVKEIALGLEQSGHKFLWSMGNTNVKELLPKEFLKRVQGRGMVSTGWAPQAEVLGHKAIGGFVSHCGWNSVLESIWYGVPIATLPVHAEQQLNAFSLVKELGISEDLKMDYRVNGEIGRAEVEKGVRRVMDSENEARKKVKELSTIARNARNEGGSSFDALSEFIRDVRGAPTSINGFETKDVNGRKSKEYTI